MAHTASVRLMTKNLVILALLVPAVSASLAAEKPNVSVPRIASDYVNV